jgi:hypothetical protein
LNGNIFQRAWQNLPLSPGERAFLKLLKSWLFTAIGVGLIAGAQYLTNNQQINVWALAWITGGAVGLSLLTALDKYFTAQGDLPLSVMTEAVTQRLQGALPGLIAQHIATMPQAQPVAQPVARPVAPQAPIAPAMTLPAPAPLYAPNALSTATAQVPFPPSGTVAQPANYYAGLDFGTASQPAVTLQTPTHQ